MIVSADLLIYQIHPIWSAEMVPLSDFKIKWSDTKNTNWMKLSPSNGNKKKEMFPCKLKTETWIDLIISSSPLKCPEGYSICVAWADFIVRVIVNNRVSKRLKLHVERS